MNKSLNKTKVYLDNNVIVDFENSEIDSHFLTANADIFECYYSDAHIEELIEGEHIPKLSVEQRINILTGLVKNNHILNGSNTPEFNSAFPRERYELLHTPVATINRLLINATTSSYRPNREKILEILRFNSIEINNIPPSTIINEINQRLLSAECPYERISIRDFLIHSEAEGRSVFITLFNLLDAACFHKDKKGAHVNIARMQDASHAYYAQLCDIFVSNDMKMRYKTSAVYSYLGIKTQVLTPKEFQEFLEKHI
ncbi:MAG: hypothetical protein KBT13_02280 [Bacteroidales bacterium]|nr:hypothetical protein [Candidatus Sodaliphilus limicaballi]